MNRPHSPARGRTSLDLHSRNRVLVVGLVVTLALPSLFVVVSHLGLAMAFAAGAVSAKAYTRRQVIVASMGLLQADGESDRSNVVDST